MKKNIYHKLLTYSAGSSAYLLLTTPLQGQVIYHDVDPDILVDSTDIFLDLNMDGVDDFKFIFNIQDAPGYAGDEWRLRINPQDSNLVAYTVQTIPVTYMGSPYYTYTGGATFIAQDVVPMLPAGTIIDGAMPFHNALANFYDKLYYYVNTSSNYVPFVFGDWMFSSEQFAAAQLLLDGELHNAWIRLSIDTNGILIHDFAYQSIPDAAITAEPAGFDPHWIAASDGGTDGNAADIHATFSAATNETDIVAYHLVVAKSGSAFSVEDLALLAADQQYIILPDGSAEYSSDFASDMRDTDGDLITNGSEYVVYIVMEIDAASGYANVLTKASDAVYLLDDVLGITGLSSVDIDNTGTGADIKVKFNEPGNTQGIAEYRIITVQKDAADAFTIDDALALPADRYTMVATGAGNYQIILPADAKDADGNLIEAERYNFFVLSVADGVSANGSALVGPSGVFVLETHTSTVQDIVLEDIGEHGDGRDVLITFDAPALEQTVEHYRLFIVNFIDAFDFDIDVALGVPAANYLSLVPTGEPYVVEGTAGMRDIQGESISWGVPYYIYIMSAPSALGLTDTLSAPSNQLILNFPVEPEAIQSVDLHTISATYQSGILHLYSEQAPAEDTRCVVYDIQGRKYKEAPWTNNDLYIQVDLPAGIYYLAIRNAKGQLLIRFYAD